MMKKWMLPLGALLLFLDRLTKRLAIAGLKDQADAALLPGVVGLTYVENTGMAFGLFANGTVVLAALSLFAVSAIVYCLIRFRDRQRGWVANAGVTLILSGILGNLYDRLAYGFVVDMIQPLFVTFPVFNVADMCLCVGAGLMVISLLFIKGDWARHA